MSLMKMALRASRSITCVVCPMILRRPHKRQFAVTASIRGLWEPDNASAKPEIPEYENLNLQFTSYDYTVLESFAKYVHNLADNMGLDTDSWAVPALSCTVHTYRPNTNTVKYMYDLIKYRRTVQLQDLPSTKLPIVLEVIRLQMPEGVEVMVKEPSDEDEAFRFLPDKQLKELYAEIHEITEMAELKKKS